MTVYPVSYNKLTGGFTTAHKGYDFDDVPNKNVYASVSGKVTRVVNTFSKSWIANNKDSDPYYTNGKRALRTEDYGNFVMIEGEGLVQLTAHFPKDAIKVKVGQTVKRGDLVGFAPGTENDTGNSTGGHTHTEYRQNGVNVKVEFSTEGTMPEKDALTECLAQHKKLVSEADKKDQAIKGLETEVLQKETEITGLKTSLEEKETENTTLGKQVSAYKGEVTKKEAQITELQTQVADLQKDSQKDVAGETSKESMRLLVSGIVGTAVTYLYSQYPVLGQIGVEQSVAVATVVAFIFRIADKAVHTIGKNIGNGALKAGLMRF